MKAKKTKQEPAKKPDITWEHQIVLSDWDHLEKDMKGMGECGWQLASACQERIRWVLFFKRARYRPSGA